MSVGLLAASWAGWIDEWPPHKAARSLANDPPEPTASWVGAGIHALIGAGAGAAYAAAVPKRSRGAISGMVFGLAVWMVGYEIVMPAATDLPPAHRDRRDRAAVILVVHLIYGAVLGILTSTRKR
jgi:hypothetical protein